jgi:hypothetical protein
VKETFLYIFKFFAAASLFPAVIGTTAALLAGYSSFEASVRDMLQLGLGSYLFCRLFVYDFSHVYLFGQKVVASLCGFLKPLISTAPFVLPIYTLFVLLGYMLATAIGQIETFRPFLLFLLSFTIVMHIVMTAGDLYAKDNVPGKPDYFFAMSLIYLVDIFLVALVSGLILPGFSFPEFFRGMVDKSGDVYLKIFRQLF